MTEGQRRLHDSTDLQRNEQSNGDYNNYIVRRLYSSGVSTARVALNIASTGAPTLYTVRGLQHGPTNRQAY